MQLKNIAKPGLPHFIAIVLFTILSFVYYYPVLEGKKLKANDSTVSAINAKEIIDFRHQFGKEALWTNSIFSGMPAYLISTHYPGNLSKHLDWLLRQYGMPVSVMFLSMLGFYILLLIFKIDPWLSIAGAIAYGLSSFFFIILGAGHNTQAIAIAYLAPFIGGVYYAYRYNAIKGALITAVVLALEINSHHPQITYYGFICLLIFIIIELIYSLRTNYTAKFIKTSLILIVPFIIAIGINFANLYSVYEYGKYSIRGKSELTANTKSVSSGLDKDYILRWSYGTGETFNMLIPNFKGGASEPFDNDSEVFKALNTNGYPSALSQFQQYWGEQPIVSGPHYLGAIVIFLFILGISLVKGPEKWWLLIATILSIMLAWGKNFMPLSNLFIDYFPAYNKFRSVTMILVIAQFCVPLLGFIALRNIFNGSVTKAEVIKGLKIATGITGGFILLVIIFPGIAGSFTSQNEATLPQWIKSALITDRKDLLKSDSFRSFVLILASSGVILGYIYNKLKKEHVILILTVLIIFDLWTVDKRYMNSDNFKRPSAIKKTFIPTPADAIILKDTSIFRVLNLSAPIFSDNTPTSYFHKSIGGYHGAKMQRYQELIDSAISYNFKLIDAYRSNAKSFEDFMTIFKRTSALNMLNTKYIIADPGNVPLLNPYALGNAWFVENPVIVPDANAEISSVISFDPSKNAIINKKFKDLIDKSSFPVSDGDTITLTSYLPNELHYKYQAADEKLVVFSEIYYPAGWKCYIDDKESEHFCADYVLRGMIVPAGQHKIKFVFEPSSYITGNKISLASSVLLILLITGYIIIEIKKKIKS